MAKLRLMSLMAFVRFQSGCAYTACKEPHSAGCVEPFVSSDESDGSSWMVWKSKFAKVYESAEEEGYRHTVWTDNTLYMMKMNAQNKMYSLGWNSRSDLTEDERAQFNKYVPNDNISATSFLGSTYRGEFHLDGNLTDLPSDWDWTYADFEVVTYVKHQSCGDCYAFSAAATLEGALAVATGWTDSLSPQQFVDCAGQNGCNGGNAQSAMMWAQSNFVCSLSSYPETGSDGTCNWGCDQIITAGSIWGTYNVKRFDEGSLCAALLQRPIYVGVAADDTFSQYSSGILSSSWTGHVNHAIVAVGYGYWNGVGYWKVKNSWGTSWGLDGYALLIRGDGANQNDILHMPVGVYVYGPYNPQMYLTDLNGVRITAPKSAQVLV